MKNTTHQAGRFNKVKKRDVLKAKIKQTGTEQIIPTTLEAGRASKEIWVEKVVPSIQKSAKATPKVVAQELGKMHQRQHFWERIKSALMHKSLGLILAMFSADIVSHFFETRRAGNLWGLTSQNRLVSDETFAMLTFIVEFVIALVVFTISDFYLEEWRNKRHQKRLQAGE